ncbi:hypothetical protein BKA66DRAFT_431659, partial [Pyrenochaeta sp. MPI-SDFR-AT-0127]
KMSGNRNQMSKSDASRIQSSQAKGGKDTGTGSFAARAQSAGDINANVGAGASKEVAGGGGNDAASGGKGAGGKK